MMMADASCMRFFACVTSLQPFPVSVLAVRRPAPRKGKRRNPRRLHGQLQQTGRAKHPLVSGSSFSGCNQFSTAVSAIHCPCQQFESSVANVQGIEPPASCQTLANKQLEKGRLLRLTSSCLPCCDAPIMLESSSRSKPARSAV